jgi:putative phage-type endonuclease
MRAIDVVQGSPDWLTARCGKITASRICDVLATIKKGESADRRNYKIQLVAERLTGNTEDNFQNSFMQWGTEQEPFARAAYEVETGRDVEQVGFFIHPTLDYAGASPDGIVGKDGLLELKCPKTSTHIQYLLAGVPPADYQPQMLWQMACTGRQWCDFVSYDPRLPGDLQFFLVRFQRDDERIAEMEKEVEKFNSEVVDLIATLYSKRPAEDPLTITASDLAL